MNNRRQKDSIARYLGTSTIIWSEISSTIGHTRKIFQCNSKGLSSRSIKINHLKRNKSTTTRSQSFVPHRLHSKSLHQFHIHLCVFRSLLFYRTQYRCAISYHQNSTNSVQEWIMVVDRLWWFTMNDTICLVLTYLPHLSPNYWANHVPQRWTNYPSLPHTHLSERNQGINKTVESGDSKETQEE